MKVAVAWEEALAYIEARVPKQVFDTWFLPLNFNSIDDSSVRIEVPNRFFGEWLTEHYGDLLAEAFAVSVGQEPGRLTISFVPSEKAADKIAPADHAVGRFAQTGRPRKIVPLNPKYTF